MLLHDSGNFLLSSLFDENIKTIRAFGVEVRVVLQESDNALA